MIPDHRPRSVRIVDDILANLELRKGFDWWWDDVDADIQQEIREDLTAIVKAYLDVQDPA